MLALLALALVGLSRDVEVAGAHGEATSLIRSVADGVSPRLPGVTVQTIPGVLSEIVVENRSAQELLVIGSLKEPFLRIGPQGVFANLNSPTWYASGNSEGVFNDPGGTDPRAAPRWKQVSRRPGWGWFDRRLESGRTPVPAEAQDGRRIVRLDSWALPARYGGRDVRLTGHIEYHPPLGTVASEVQTPMPAAGIGVALVGGPRPGLSLRTGRNTPVTVIGRTGEPFARIGPRFVEVNTRSATYADAAAAGGTTPPATDPSAAPRWRRIAEDRLYGWIDARIRYPRLEPPDDVQRRGKRAVLKNWTIPLEVDGRRVNVRGTTNWVPLPAVARPSADKAGVGLGTWLGGSAALILVLGLLALAVRRRQAGAAPRRRAEPVG